MTGNTGLTGATGTAGTIPAGANEVLYVNAAATDVDGEPAFTYTASTNLLEVDTLHLADGAVGTPAYSFGSDTNTGIYRISSDKIGIACGGTLIASIDSSAGFVIETGTDFIPPLGGVDTTNPTTIGTGELGKTIPRTNTTATSITAGLGVGAQFSVILDTTGTLTISRSGGETINNATSVSLDTQFAGATFIKCDTDSWYAVGLLA